jgi:hypothetical protein
MPLPGCGIRPKLSLVAKAFCIPDSSRAKVFVTVETLHPGSRAVLVKATAQDSIAAACGAISGSLNDKDVFIRSNRR